MLLCHVLASVWAQNLVTVVPTAQALSTTLLQMMSNWLLYHGATNHTTLRLAKKAFKQTLQCVDIPPDAVEMMDKFALICEYVLQQNTEAAIRNLTPLVYEHHPLQEAAYHLLQILQPEDDSTEQDKKEL